MIPRLSSSMLRPMEAELERLWNWPAVNHMDPWYPMTNWKMDNPMMPSFSALAMPVIQKDDKGHVVLHTQLPSTVNKDDVSIHFENGMLKLVASKHIKKSKPDKHWHTSSSFSMSHIWPIPEKLTIDDIEANWNTREHSIDITITPTADMELEQLEGETIPMAIAGPHSKRAFGQGQKFNQKKMKHTEASAMKDESDMPTDTTVPIHESKQDNHNPMEEIVYKPQVHHELEGAGKSMRL